MTINEKRAAIFDEIDAERVRQDAKWGEQNHPMVPEGFPLAVARSVTADARRVCDLSAQVGKIAYTSILAEEHCEFIEACVEHGETSDEARTELVQAVAVGVAMLEAIDRKRAAEKGGA